MISDRGSARRLRHLAGDATLAAGVIHAFAARSHADGGDLRTLFIVAAVAQVLVGIALLLTPSRRLLVAAAVLGLAAAGFWALTRTIGVAFPAGLEEAEPVGAGDLIAATLAISAAAACVLVLRVDRLALHMSARVATVATVLVAVMAVPALADTTEHDHDHGHPSTEDDSESHSNHDHPDDDEGHGDAEHPTSEPVKVDDTHPGAREHESTPDVSTPPTEPDISEPEIPEPQVSKPDIHVHDDGASHVHN